MLFKGSLFIVTIDIKFVPKLGVGILQIQNLFFLFYIMHFANITLHSIDTIIFVRFCIKLNFFLYVSQIIKLIVLTKFLSFLMLPNKAHFTNGHESELYLIELIVKIICSYYLIYFLQKPMMSF